MSNVYDKPDQSAKQARVKRLGSPARSAVPGNARVKRLPTRGRSPYGGRR
jgi:hypothetical protein